MPWETMTLLSSEPETTLSSRVKTAHVTVLQIKTNSFITKSLANVEGEIKLCACKVKYLLCMALENRNRVNRLSKIPEPEGCIN